MKNTNVTKRIVLSGLFLALGLIMPFLTGQIPQLGGMLLPMHLPVLLCGFVCGIPFGAAVGFITPLLRSLIFGMPSLFPSATVMAFELCAYGALAGLFYKLLPKKVWGVYAALLLAMLGGRVVWGAVSLIVYQLISKAFTWELFFAGAFVNAVPGIILQIVVIPPIIFALARVGYVFVDGKSASAEKDTAEAQAE